MSSHSEPHDAHILPSSLPVHLQPKYDIVMNPPMHGASNGPVRLVLALLSFRDLVELACEHGHCENCDGNSPVPIVEQV